MASFSQWNKAGALLGEDPLSAIQHRDTALELGEEVPTLKAVWADAYLTKSAIRSSNRPLILDNNLGLSSLGAIEKLTRWLGGALTSLQAIKDPTRYGINSYKH